MLRIRRVYQATLPSDRSCVEQVQEIFREAFAAVAGYADKIPELLNFPFKSGYTTAILVAETGLGKVMGFSLLLHFPEIHSSLLDFIAVSSGSRGTGVGGELYEATREYLQALGSRGLYMEVLPDDPEVLRSEREVEENRRRMRFFESYGVRPVIGTEYERPIGKEPGPHLLFDGLGRNEPLRRAECRAAVRLILQRKYGARVPPGYIEHVVESFVDDPVRFREPRYFRTADRPKPVRTGRLQTGFAMTVCTQHKIHHVRDRGYVERPARVDAVLEALAPLTFLGRVPTRHFGQNHICAVHDTDFVAYLKAVCERLEPKRPVYPYVFPIRRPERRPKELAMRAGYYCIDTFTPLDRNAYRAARESVDVVLTAAEEVLQGRRVAYALCRPPGHHAERRVFGGFCYFNNAAIAAHFLSRHGKVALLDVDFHHGNGAQDIFYRRADVLTLSIHGHPDYAYPYFSGFADENGEGDGRGCNRNFPLPENAGESQYLEALDKAIRLIERFRPMFLVLPLGLDTMKGDLTGSFTLRADSMRKIAERVGRLALPTLVVQEGGYNLRNLKRGIVTFFTGLADTVERRFA